MMHSVELTLKQQPEVLERVLRVTRHRGFTITELTMTVNEDSTLKVNFDVKSERVIGLLTHQLTKLFDVLDCQVITSSVAQTEAELSA
ncbi:MULTISPECIES: acetolactate synthase 2 small subunit [Shewanella]|uniref:acetolactate synthase 2 small subunit n=1 Tax=Shewanella TaxID=22 RepID=UPI001BC15478|nr:MULTISPECIES: acetolactate synthase 2 small subunit [Shewanella]GIU49046.1 acetolactate synthase [Shewanella sp. KT0246]